MRKDCHAAHDGLDWVCIHDSFSDTGDEEGRFSTLKLVVEVNEESEEGGLAGRGGRGVVLVGVGDRVDARRRPSAVYEIVSKWNKWEDY